MAAVVVLPVGEQVQAYLCPTQASIVAMCQPAPGKHLLWFAVPRRVLQPFVDPRQEYDYE